METLDRGTLINSAAVFGGVLGLISGGYVFITSLLGDSVAGGVVDSVLWIAKLVGCIWIMRWGMMRLAKNYEGVTIREVRNFGLLTAAFSAIITAAATYIAYEYAFPDVIDKQLDQVYQVYGKFLDSNSMAMLDKMSENYSVINFFSQLIWCFIYGSLLTLILSGRVVGKTAPQDFFADAKKALEEAQAKLEEEQDEDEDDSDEEDDSKKSSDGSEE